MGEMTTMTENHDRSTPQTSEGLHARLRGAWRREVKFHLVCSLGWAMAALVAMLLADFLLDWGLELPALARALLALVNLAVLGGIIYIWFYRHVRGYNPVMLALRVEKTVPQLKSLLVSAVQLDESQARDGTSPGLIRAIKRQAAAATTHTDFSAIVDFRRAWPAIRATVAAILIMGLWMALRPGYVGALLVRMGNPWTATIYPTRTHISLITRDLTVRSSDPVTLQAQASGDIPTHGVLLVCFAGANWESVDLTRSGRDEFAHVFEQVSADFDYRFRIGDAISPKHHVTVVHGPHIEQATAHLDYPAYTKLGSEDMANFNLKVPEGTKITWRMKLDRPIKKAEMLLENKDPAPLTLTSGGQSVQIAALADASSSYRFQLTWQLDGRNYVDDGPKHFLRVIPDRAPRAELTYPTEDEKATLDKTLTLAFRAQDDYSLENAWIVYAINDGAEQRRPAIPLDAEATVEKEITWSIKSDNPGLKEGDILTFAIEVSHGRTSLPAARPTTSPSAATAHIARTKSHRVQFVSAKDYLEYTMNRQRKYLGQIRPLYLQERDASEHVRELETPTTLPATMPTTLPAMRGTLGKDAQP